MKKTKALLGGLAIAAVLGANGYMALSDTASVSELSVDGVENLADAAETNPWYKWIPYGYTADEYHKDWPCTVTMSLSISHILGFGGSDEYPGHYRQCYDGGSENCDGFSCTRDSDLYAMGIRY